MNHRRMRPALSALLAGLLLMAGAPASATGPVNTPAPDFTLKATDGENLRFAEYRGQVVLVNFWASWCGPCRQEMPLLDQLHKKYAPLGFTVLGVNVDQDAKQARAMLDKVPVTFPVVLDSQSAVSKSYQVVAMPTTVIVDRSGNARYVHHGYKPGDEAEYLKHVRALLAEKP